MKVRELYVTVVSLCVLWRYFWFLSPWPNCLFLLVLFFVLFLMPTLGVHRTSAFLGIPIKHLLDESFKLFPTKKAFASKATAYS